MTEFMVCDFWIAHDGLLLLSGGYYDRYRQTKPFGVPDEFLSEEQKQKDRKKENLSDMRGVQIATAKYLLELRLARFLESITGIWEKSIHPNETAYLSGKRDDPLSLRYSPEYFIDWALSKRFTPDWLDWAIEQKLYTPKELRNLPAPAQNTPAAPEFNKANPNYPPELAYALEAWRAVSATEGKGKPKARIKAWLDTNTKLSDKAKERIAVVANWEKLGGATSTE